MLADIGIFQVGWQSYGKAPVMMPPSWTGHFDERTGISHTAWERVMEREALLLHSPWHVPTGATWVDYPLVLPDSKSILLTFGIAMGPDVAMPNKSDGVTFSCYLSANGQKRKLMRKHYRKAKWLDYRFDLSEYAGQTVTLRLQVEPGPKRNASWDYSFFGNAKILVGKAGGNRIDVLTRAIRTKAYQATKSISREKLSNSSGHGTTPSNLLPFNNALESIGSDWCFVYQGEDCRLVYTYEPATGTLDDFTVQIDDRAHFSPAQGGGITVVLESDKNQPGGVPRQITIPLRGGKPLQISRDDEVLNVLWEYNLKGNPLRVAWSFGIVGKALVVAVRCDDPQVSQFSLGNVGMAALRKTFTIPYLSGQLDYLSAQQVFVCRYLDWTVSHSSSCPQGIATYQTKTDGSRNLLFESGYISVSPDIGEVLPNIPHPPSPYIAELGSRIMLDIWGHHQGSYAGDTAKLRELKDNGVDHLAIIQHVWQRYGYDVKLPDHIPANPRYGDDADLVQFGRTANACGYIWSLHENYIDLYPDAPSYDASARVIKSDGSPSPAWFNQSTQVQSYGLKSNRALGYAIQNSPEIHRRYGTTAAYLDVHTCVPPWHQLDHEAGQPRAAMALGKVKFDAKLFQFERDTHGGPLFGEGNNHFYWAGLCDGVEAQIAGGEDHSPLLDFDLLKLHPQMVNHGMGYYERWFRQGRSAQWGVDVGSVEQLDKYRAMELAYGHAGFIGNRLTHNVSSVIREHHLMHPVQRLYAKARPVEILYAVEGEFVTASVALVVGDTSRQRIRYNNGLTLWVNWNTTPWKIEIPSGNHNDSSGSLNHAHILSSSSRLLPQWGFLALGPGTEVSTILRNGKVIDYAECPEYIFVDTRTRFDQPYLHSRKKIEPRLRSFKHLGGNRVEITYEWIVNDTLEDDFACFVHGIPVNGSEVGDIDFQQDHGFSKPTRQWRKGEVIVDGPHELRIPDKRDNYDLVIGLHKGSRVPLTGVQTPGRRILVARLKVERSAGEIVKLTARKATPEMLPDEVKKADFTAHTNPLGTWMDFGKLATDGAVKINREKDRLVIFPYPREQKFRLQLNIPELAPGADPSRIKVRALAAETQQDLGPVKVKLTGLRLILNLATPEAGRYVVTWQ